ncbi:MAG: hypothetical protein R3F61_02940 [Myxococcota bacterium]
MRILKLVFGLALTLGASSAWATDALTQRFLSSDYTLCDALMVSKLFDFSQADAKSYIGQKIEWGTTHILDGDLKRAREKGAKDATYRCQFHQSGYGYDDAEVLAKYWGLNVSDAKTRVEQKIQAGNESFFRKEVLPAARREAGLPTGEDPASTMARKTDLEAFFDSKYDYCHAKMLVGTHFGSSASEAKELIGYKVKNGWTDFVDQMLDGVRKKHQSANTKPCTFAETRYTPDDAEKLAQLWGSSLSETKARIESKYVWGSEEVIASELEQAKLGSGPRMGGQP